jgi:hypothetical protein
VVVVVEMAFMAAAEVFPSTARKTTAGVAKPASATMSAAASIMVGRECGDGAKGESRAQN